MTLTFNEAEEGFGAMPMVMNDAQYDALPSGSLFVGADGKTRRKP